MNVEGRISSHLSRAGKLIWAIDSPLTFTHPELIGAELLEREGRVE